MISLDNVLSDLIENIYSFNYSIEQYYKVTAIVFRLSSTCFSLQHNKKVLFAYDNAHVHVIHGTITT